ncbi:MAG: DUF2000 domain-containing protein [Candidatus Sungbacteria bacterium]|nr:DUF2000 domain-containing protein [Candidatus Sungbacteria bacterium]
MTVVLRDDVASWQLTNTIGHIAAYLGNKMSEPFDTGKYFTSKDGVDFPRNSQFPIVVLKADRNQLRDLAGKLKNSHLSRIIYVQEMIDMIDDEELADVLKTKTFEDMDILGIGIFGAKEELKTLTGGFKLWK